jgi:hypothetical protein
VAEQQGQIVTDGIWSLQQVGGVPQETRWDARWQPANEFARWARANQGTTAIPFSALANVVARVQLAAIKGVRSCSNDSRIAALWFGSPRL